MNHQKIYNNIILKAKSEYRVKHLGIYYENHHIIPKCLNGGEEIENKVLLTAKEHYVCHKLLTYIYPNNSKIIYAFHLMTFCKNKNYKISSKDYAYAKELISLILVSEETKNKMSNANKGRKHSDETKLKIRNSHLGLLHSEKTKQKMKKPKSIEHIENLSKHHANVSGLNNPMFNNNFYKIWIQKYGEQVANKKIYEYKNKMSKSQKGKTHTEETKLKIHYSNIGKHNHTGIKNPMFNKKHSEESKQKMSESAKNRKKI
jgi:hypothetical protein